MIVAIASKSNIVSLWFMVAPQMLLTLYHNSSKQFPSTTFKISYILFLEAFDIDICCFFILLFLLMQG